MALRKFRMFCKRSRTIRFRGKLADPIWIGVPLLTIVLEAHGSSVRFKDDPEVSSGHFAPKGCDALSRLSTISLAEGCPVMAFLIASFVAS